MSWRHISAALACACALLATPSYAADGYPLAQGLHQWSVSGGKLFLVVGTYQDITAYRRTYTFYFKTPDDDAWIQVVAPSDVAGGQSFTWNSVTHGEYTFADAVVVQRPDGVYFVVVRKSLNGAATYADKQTASATWYKLTLSDDGHQDDAPYQFKAVFKRPYPRSAQTVDALLAREAALHPRR